MLRSRVVLRSKAMVNEMAFDPHSARLEAQDNNCWYLIYD